MVCTGGQYAEFICLHREVSRAHGLGHTNKLSNTNSGEQHRRSEDLAWHSEAVAPVKHCETESTAC